MLPNVFKTLLKDLLFVLYNPVLDHHLDDMTAIMLPSMHLRNAIKREMPISTIVLTLPELLEMILSYASEEDLLFQQRVNTTWRRIINTSPELQEKLFLTSKVPEGDVDLTGLEWNPLLRHLGGRKDDLEGHDRCRSTDLKILEMSDYPGASWQKMFITRPAIGGLLMRDVIPHPLESHPLCTLWIEKGIMMSDVWGFQKMHGMYLHLRDREGRMPVHLCAPCCTHSALPFHHHFPIANNT